MKRSFLLADARSVLLTASGTGLIAATYGLVRLAYGLFLPDVQADLSFGAATAGRISSGASIVYCVGAIVAFAVASRHPRSVILAAAATASAGSLGMATAPDTTWFAAFAILGSAGAGFASPGLVSIVRRNGPTGDTDRRQAIVNAGTGPGLVAAGILALLFLPDWRRAWLVVAAVTLVLATVVLLSDRAGASLQREEGVIGPRIPPLSWFQAHGLPLAAALLLGVGSAATWNFGRTHLVAAGVDHGWTVLAWIALGVGGTAVIATARMMSALLPHRAWTLTTLAVTLATLVLGIVPAIPAVALLACGAFGWGYTAATGALIAWTTRIDPSRAPAGTSMAFVVLVLGQAIGATVLGTLLSGAGSVTAFLVATAIVLAAAVAPGVSGERGEVLTDPREPVTHHRRASPVPRRSRRTSPHRARRFS
ncbi:MFS transporter [Planctomonas psychrotolerans]|uniref:MFS transporter n=1 Tax=Planctomonas psychrotolerans TaxID=2528712 RepID=UPI001D0D7F1E|nr:MFS transporter [Planctomonas psychrotolerans]